MATKLHQKENFVHVTIEYQTKINKFVKYNINLVDLKDELQVKKNDFINEIELLIKTNKSHLLWVKYLFHIIWQKHKS